MKKVNIEELIQRRIIPHDELKSYYPNLNDNDYTDLIYASFLQQKHNWKMFNDGWKGFLSSEYKKFQFDWFSVKVQFNPTRFVSSSAKVDEESIKKRKCFLCLENLPAEQKGILFESKSNSGERLIFLCNPAPIFNEHFTVSSVYHTPQEIFNRINIMLELADLCNNEYTIFYNGPKCGASAPDHFHFQASPADELPTEKDFFNNKEKFLILLKTKEYEIRYIESKNYLRNVLIFSSIGSSFIERLFNNFYEALQRITETNHEPMMNLIALRRGEKYHLIIFPREKHRPSCYYAEGDENMLISPGLVDMSGMLITPLQKDFERISEDTIRNIYSEVTISDSKFLQLLEYLSLIK